MPSPHTKHMPALVVATTEASLQTPGGGLPYTRRELLVKIALGLWSPYAEAMLSELNELDEDERKMGAKEQFGALG